MGTKITATTTIEIAGKARNVRVTKFAGKEGMLHLARFSALVGPAFAVGLKDGSQMGEVIADVCSRLADKDMAWLIDTFTPLTEIELSDVKPPIWMQLNTGDLFDATFDDDYMAIVLWLRFCIEVNFSRFLASIGIKLHLPVKEPSE